MSTEWCLMRLSKRNIISIATAAFTPLVIFKKLYSKYDYIFIFIKENVLFSFNHLKNVRLKNLCSGKSITKYDYEKNQENK